VADVALRNRRELLDGSFAVWVAIVCGLVATGLWLYGLTHGTTLSQDEWVWALYRRGHSLGTFLRPHNQHLSLVPLVIYRLLFASAGLAHYGPYRAVVTAAHLACVTTLFVYARRRVGTVLGTCAAAVILFFGPGWGDVLWPFQLAWLISLTSGIGALLALDRSDRTGRLWACALLAVSLASSGLGLIVLVGMTVELLWRRSWRRLWVVGAPAALYAVWWVIYQQSGPTSRVTLLPRFVADEVASSAAALTGLAGNVTGVSSGTLLSFGRPVAAILIALIVWRLLRLRHVPARVLSLVSMLGSFWVLTAVTRAFIGPEEAWASRYLYVGALFIVLLAVELARGVTPPLPVIGIAVLITAAGVVSNIGQMTGGARDLRARAQIVRAEIGALDIARPITPPGYVSLVPNFPFPVVRAGPYFAAEREYGTPAASPAEIATMSEAAREAADTELIQIHRIVPRAAPSAGCSGARSTSSPPPGSSRRELTADAEGLLIHPLRERVQVEIRRFGARAEYVGSVPNGATMLLPIGADLTPRPWHVTLVASGPVRWCVPT
jgi:hypothetical protein